MYYSKINDNLFILRLVKGEKVNSSIKSFCQKKEIKNAAVYGIGSVEKPTLAHYRVDTKKYSEKTMDGIYELTALMGNVGIFENEPLVHTHATLSDEEMKSIGGHLVEAIVSATAELVLTKVDSKHTKSYNEEIGLRLWDLPDKI